MSAVGTMIFTTGASRAREIGFLSEESRAICRLFDLPEFTCEVQESHAARVRILDAAGAVGAELPFGSLCDADDAFEVIRMLSEESSAIVIPNMIALAHWRRLPPGSPRRARAR